MTVPRQQISVVTPVDAAPQGAIKINSNATQCDADSATLATHTASIASQAAAITALQGSVAVPPQAAAVGYTTLVLGPSITIGQNWSNFNLLGVTPNAGQAIQNSDGSVSMGAVADGSGFGACLSTAWKVGTHWTGLAIGGGCYVEALIAFTPTVNSGAPAEPVPAFWADEINYLAQIGGSIQWAGQTAGYDHWIEWDILQWPHNSLQFFVGNTLLDWYNTNASIADVAVPSGGAEVPINVPFATPHRYGALWVPATATSQGYIKNYIDGVQVNYGSSSPILWNQYNPAAAPPPVLGSSAGSLIDVSHLALILGTDTTCPMTVYSVSVWQGAGGANQTGPFPTITSMVPNPLLHGASTFTLAVNGTNFSRLAVINWNGTPLTTTYGSANQLFASVSSTLVASAGTAAVTVTNPSGTNSNSVTFTIS